MNQKRSEMVVNLKFIRYTCRGIIAFLQSSVYDKLGYEEYDIVTLNLFLRTQEDQTKYQMLQQKCSIKN